MNDLAYVTLETKFIVVWYTIIECWIPNSEIRLTSNAGFEKSDTVRLGP
jgi:hypothetical protein